MRATTTLTVEEKMRGIAESIVAQVDAGKSAEEAMAYAAEYLSIPMEAVAHCLIRQLTPEQRQELLARAEAI